MTLRRRSSLRRSSLHHGRFQAGRRRDRNVMSGDAIMQVIGRLSELRDGGIVKVPAADGVAIGSPQPVRSRRI
jgi:hypothetical protein